MQLYAMESEEMTDQSQDCVVHPQVLAVTGLRL
jgi:hypothetical protein